MRRRNVSLLDNVRTTVAVSKSTALEFSDCARRMNINVADLVEFALRAVIDGRVNLDDVRRATYEAAVAALQARMGYKP